MAYPISILGIIARILRIMISIMGTLRGITVCIPIGIIARITGIIRTIIGTIFCKTICMTGELLPDRAPHAFVS